MSDAVWIGRDKPLLNPVTFVLCPYSVILWLGDLNYRIEELDVEKVKALIEEKAFQILYAYDQVQMPRCVFLGQLLLHCESMEPSFSFPSLEASLRTQSPLLPAFHLHSFLLALSRKHFVSLRVRTHFLIQSRDQELGSKGPYVIGFVSSFSKETSWYTSGGLLILFRMSSLPLPPPCYQFSPVGANLLGSSLFPTATRVVVSL